MILITTTFGSEIWINPAFIKVIRANDRDDNNDTLIFVTENDLPIRVSDTVEEIINQINISSEGLEERAHYAEGTAQANIDRANQAEAEVERLKARNAGSENAMDIIERAAKLLGPSMVELDVAKAEIERLRAALQRCIEELEQWHDAKAVLAIARAALEAKL